MREPFTHLGPDDERTAILTGHAWTTPSWTGDVPGQVYLLVFDCPTLTLSCGCAGARRWYKGGVDWRRARHEGCKHGKALKAYIEDNG